MSTKERIETVSMNHKVDLIGVSMRCGWFDLEITFCIVDRTKTPIVSGCPKNRSNSETTKYVGTDLLSPIYILVFWHFQKELVGQQQPWWLSDMNWISSWISRHWIRFGLQTAFFSVAESLVLRSTYLLNRLSNGVDYIICWCSDAVACRFNFTKIYHKIIDIKPDLWKQIHDLTLISTYLVH